MGLPRHGAHTRAQQRRKGLPPRLAATSIRRTYIGAAAGEKASAAAARVSNRTEAQTGPRQLGSATRRRVAALPGNLRRLARGRYAEFAWRRARCAHVPESRGPIRIPAARPAAVAALPPSAPEVRAVIVMRFRRGRSGGLIRDARARCGTRELGGMGGNG